MRCAGCKCVFFVWLLVTCLCPFSADAASQLDILWHDGHALGMDGTQVGIFEESNQVCLSCLLQGQHSRALEAKVGLEVLCDLTDQTLERKLTDQQFRALLVLADFTQCHGTGPVAMGLLHSAGGRCRLARGLGGQLLAGCLSSRGFTGGLLGTCHGSGVGTWSEAHGTRRVGVTVLQF